MFDLRRSQKITPHEYKNGRILYWMARDQRLNDNWALIYAQELARRHNQDFTVVFCLLPKFMGASLRHYDFMLKGLEKVCVDLKKLNIGFEILVDSPENVIPEYIQKNGVGFLIADYSPLKISKQWKKKVSEKITIPFTQIDTHNIVPVWEASNKQEYGAYTLRPKIKKLIPEFLTEFTKIEKQNLSGNLKEIEWENIYKLLNNDKSVKPIERIKPGESEAKKVLSNFIENKLSGYEDNRNDPNKDSQSNLSPYLHFGQISAQRVALEISKIHIHENSKETFLEELIVRKELSDNYCHYCNDYDNFNGFPNWSKNTLTSHLTDRREFLYSEEQLENAKTHDDLWNTAQKEMVHAGKMHGYMRMYWAKKILEWSKTPQEAQKTAIYLNDKYQLDGRDPNGYTGIAWSIGGVHDRPWFEREIFGKVRYMSYNGAKNKFDIKEYIDKYSKPSEQQK